MYEGKKATDRNSSPLFLIKFPFGINLSFFG